MIINTSSSMLFAETNCLLILSYIFSQISIYIISMQYSLVYWRAYMRFIVPDIFPNRKSINIYIYIYILSINRNINKYIYDNIFYINIL